MELGFRYWGFGNENNVYVNRIRGSAIELGFSIGNHMYGDRTRNTTRVTISSINSSFDGDIGVQWWNWDWGSAVELDFGGANYLYNNVMRYPAGSLGYSDGSGG